MKTLKLTAMIQKLNGFDEETFISILAKDLQDVGVKEIRYSEIVGGYIFELDYDIAIPQYPYQPILGTFATIKLEYDKVKAISIPADKIELV